jgi:hypothetical protein
MLGVTPLSVFRTFTATRVLFQVPSTTRELFVVENEMICHGVSTQIEYLLTAGADLAPKFDIKGCDHPALPSDRILGMAHCREAANAVRKKFKFSIPS